MSNNEALIKRLDECRNILMSGDGEWSDAEQMDRTVTEVIERIAELTAERDALASYVEHLAHLVEQGEEARITAFVVEQNVLPFKD